MGKKSKKSMDLWGGADGKAVVAPQAVRTSKQWTLPAEAVIDSASYKGARRRLIPVKKPNLRPAVAAPLEGQSYNPTDEGHQDAIKKATKQLDKKVKKHERLIKKLTYTGESANYKGNFEADKTWEEEVKELKPKKAKSAAAKEAEEKKKKKKKKKVSRQSEKRATKRNEVHRRHPDRSKIEKQLEQNQLEKILSGVQQKRIEREENAIAKKIDRSDNLQIKNFGRYHHQPLTTDVLPSSQLVGSLRHMSGSVAAHPAMDRLKSLEERNMIPARLRHKSHVRKVLKPKGDVRIKREDMGVMPECGF